MKVLITTPDLNAIGGVSSYYNSIRSHLPLGVEYFTIGARVGEKNILFGMWRILRDYMALRKLLKTHKYDVIHLNPSFLFKAALRDGLFHRLAKSEGVKTVVFFHGWDKGFESVVEAKGLWLFKWLYGNADAFIVLASEFKLWLLKQAIAVPIYCETTVVDDSILEYKMQGRMGSRLCGEKNYNILYLSRLDRSKGLFEAIQTFILLKKKYDNITLTIAGDGPEMEAAQAMSLEVEGIRFLGYVRKQDKHQAFMNADLYLFPSFYGEGMPISVLEAMAYGLPVITRRVGGIPDFFINGFMGFATDSRHPSDFADYIVLIRDTPNMSDRISNHNYHYAREHFSPKVIVCRLLDIYKSVKSI